MAGKAKGGKGSKVCIIFGVPVPYIPTDLSVACTRALDRSVLGVTERFFVIAFKVRDASFPQVSTPQYIAFATC